MLQLRESTPARPHTIRFWRIVLKRNRRIDPASLACRCADKSNVRLRQVITERGEDHAVESFRRDSGLSFSSRSNSRPGLAGHVGILRTPLQPALGAAIEAVPEARRTLDERSRIGRAVGKTAGKESATDTRRGFGVAAGVGEQRRPITYILIGERIEIGRAAGVLGAGVEVDINLGPVPLQRRE